MVDRSHFRHSSVRKVRWPAANLCRNPFGELTRQERAELAVVDVDSILEPLSGPSDSRACSPREFHSRRASQLIGDCGRGKTTRMLAIHQCVPESVYVYLPEDAPCPPIPDASLLLIDEAQRLPAAVRRMVFSTGRPLVLATHTDLSRALKRFGYRVNTERIGLTLTPERLVAMLNRRVESSRRDKARPVPRVTESVADQLIRRFGTDVRAIEGYLYDLVQSQVDDHGEMRFID